MDFIFIISDKAVVGTVVGFIFTISDNMVVDGVFSLTISDKAVIDGFYFHCFRQSYDWWVLFSLFQTKL